MTRLLSGALASAMALAFLFAGPAIAKSSGHTMHSSMMTTHHTRMKHSCPTGEHWVKGYKRNSKYVHGYCRK